MCTDAALFEKAVVRTGKPPYMVTICDIEDQRFLEYVNRTINQANDGATGNESD